MDTLQTDHLRQQVRQVIRAYQQEVARVRNRWRRAGVPEAEVAERAQDVAARFRERLAPLQTRCSHSFLPWEAVAEAGRVIAREDERRCRCCFLRETRPHAPREAANDDQAEA